MADSSIRVEVPQEVLQWKLCYVRNPFLYFCSPKNYKIARGDDWNDAPYQYNAGPPSNVDCYIIAVYGVYEPARSFSVDDIRARTGWFLEYGYGEPHERIPAGITLSEMLDIAKRNGLDVYFPLTEVNGDS